jgi:hypothetical protein
MPLAMTGDQIRKSVGFGCGGRMICISGGFDNAPLRNLK